MIAHVAEAAEDKGRVVLRLASAGEVSGVAIDAALSVAKAFQSQIESLFVEDRQLIDLASFPFAREIPLSGGQSRAIQLPDIEREMRHVASAFHRKVIQAAREFDIPVHCRVMREEPVRALALTCAERGPWNVVTLAEPFLSSSASTLAELFSTVEDTTGIIVAGPGAQRTAGTVVAVIDEIERVPPMLRAAERLAAALASDVRLLLVDDGTERLQWLEGHIRLALEGSTAKLDIVDMARADASSVAEQLRRLGAGFVIARFGGLLASEESEVSTLARLLEGPLFLVR